ncbi:hypothetical protein LXA43DRAFT_404146 [Ganoderma leucocontextum]|nr:hypothetical protein LXA43DRAFT_404146 [Ganoderma leucocontextum]
MLVITEGQPHPPRQAQRRRTDHGQFVGLTVLMVVNVDVLVPVPEGVEPRLASLAADWLAMICHGVHSGAKLKPPQNDAAHKSTGNDTKENMSSRELKVLVYGAEGPGMLALQIAKHCGAEVFACDPTPRNRILAMKAINRLGSVFAPEEAEEGEIPVEVDIVIDMVHDDESMRVGGALIRRTQEIKHWAVLVR